MTIIIVDVEANGPCPGIYSMVSLGAVVLSRELDKTFYATFAPPFIDSNEEYYNEEFDEEAYKVLGINLQIHKTYDPPYESITKFNKWLSEVSPVDKPLFISDNPAFDWQFVNYYFHNYIHYNPFGFSARRIGDLYAGLNKDFNQGNKWKQFRKTKHTHHPVDDAKGNAEALLYMIDNLGLKIKGI